MLVSILFYSQGLLWTSAFTTWESECRSTPASSYMALWIKPRAPCMLGNHYTNWVMNIHSQEMGRKSHAKLGRHWQLADAECGPWKLSHAPVEGHISASSTDWTWWVQHGCRQDRKLDGQGRAVAGSVQREGRRLTGSKHTEEILIKNCRICY